MRILFDHGTPAPLTAFLGGHIVQRYVRRIAACVDAATPGSYAEIDIPFR
jgi:hypothetical protein